MLNRISTLIFIQIVFIFSALALIFYFSKDEDSYSRAHINLGQILEALANQAYLRLEIETDLLNPDSSLISEINNLVAQGELPTSVSLVYMDTLTGRARLINYGITEHKQIFTDDVKNPLGEVLKLLHASGKQYIVSVTDDGRYLTYVFRPQNGSENYALTMTVPNIMIQKSIGSHGYILLLLFLISALISLLIINLIFREIKKPINLLLEGIEKVAAGQEFRVVETGDRKIRGLICAFNEMSQKLNDKRRELDKANRELIKTNKSLIESESILTTLVDYSPDAIIVTDLEDQVIIYNQAAARDFGYNASDMTGKKITNLIQMARDGSETGFDRENQEVQEIICRRKNGFKFPAVIVHTTLGPDGGRPIAMLYFVKNISESRNYQEMILKLDRIASRGKMARDIAHEINNYLAILQGNLELVPMIMAKNDMDKVSQKLKIMRETVEKISNFTDGLTRFSDEQSGFEKSDLNQLVENLIAFLKPQNKFDNTIITTNLSDSLPLVEIDIAQIQRLLANLITNAAEAMENIEDDRWIVVSTSIDDSRENAIIKVADGGPGIKEDYIPGLFVKRFSTRREGTGLGLIACKRIVEFHRGEISFHTSDDSQAVFEIRIPIGRLDEENTETSKSTASQTVS
nr:PAS domain S-box protein [candidate division Zixibacteria bacterium]